MTTRRLDRPTMQRASSVHRTLHSLRHTSDEIRVPAFEEVKEPLFEVAQERKGDGKIGEVACFPHTRGEARREVAQEPFEGVVHFFDLLETEMLELFPTLQRQNMSFIAFRPIRQGMLTDKRVDRSALPEGDPRREERWDRWYELLGEVSEVSGVIGDIGEQPGSWTEFALQFSLAHPAVTTVVIGRNTVEQVERALAAVDAGHPVRRSGRRRPSRVQRGNGSHDSIS